jgi:hypothetical protein
MFRATQIIQYGVTALEKDMAIPCEVRLAGKRFPTR